MNLWPQKPVAVVHSHFLLSKGIEVPLGWHYFKRKFWQVIKFLFPT
jgi:hypothetical protein